MATYTSQYPPAQSTTYVKATSDNGEHYRPWMGTDPALSLIGNYEDNAWLSYGVGNDTNQRFHIDLGSTKIIKRIYYENAHQSGAQTDVGCRNFTFWGSNEADDFADLVYANDGTWTQLTELSQSTFDQHVAADQADPKYITVTNSTAYRYYACKFADNYGQEGFMGFRRVELQIEDIVAVNSIFFGANF